MSNIVPTMNGQISKRFANHTAQDDLSAGIASSFGVLGYKGKTWSLRYRGESHTLMRDDGDGPRNSVDVVILKAAPHLSKIYYEQGYVEGSTEAPDCYSLNAIAPELNSRKRQNDACGTCRHNVWGSRVSPAGKAGKACSDSKRVAVVPLNDINNETFGGPLLLRVPAASLQEFAQFGQKMRQLGYLYYSIGVQIAFDVKEAYPKFKFMPIRPLNDEEAELVISLRDSPAVDRILSGGEYTAGATAPVLAQAPESVFMQPGAHGGQSRVFQQVADQQDEIAPAPAAATASPTTSVSAPVKTKEAAAAPTPPKSPSISGTKATGFGPLSPSTGEEPQTPAPAAATTGANTATPAGTTSRASATTGKKKGNGGAPAVMNSSTNGDHNPEGNEDDGETDFEVALRNKLGSILPDA